MFARQQPSRLGGMGEGPVGVGYNGKITCSFIRADESSTPMDQAFFP